MTKKNFMLRLAASAFRLAMRGLLVTIILPTLYLIEPFYRLRLGTMYTQRLGHMTLNTETFLRKMQLNGPTPRTRTFLFGCDPVNRQLMEMWKRLKGYPVRFIESRWGTRLLHYWRPILMRTRFWEGHRWAGTEYHLYSNTQPVLSFTEDEDQRGREELAAMGIGPDDWFVLFFARDGTFLRQWRPEQTSTWESIDFRNADIMNYMKAAEYIASLGGYALRFGAVVEKPLPETDNPRIIDYATKYRNDFMDVYLPSKCRFFISSGSGPEGLAVIFNVPIMTANKIPYNHTQYFSHSVLLPRHLATPDGDRRVGYWEAQEAGYYVGWTEATSVHETSQIFKMLENDPDDILDGVKDLIDLLEGREPPPEAREIQDLYGALYLSHAPEYKEGARISARFALKYRDLIVPGDGGAHVPKAN